MPSRSDRVTIVDVARAASTSVSSASVAMRGEAGVSEGTRQRIRDIAARLGYQPDQRARTLREQRSTLLGVTYAVSEAFHAEVVESLYRVVDGSGYGLVLGATTRDRTEVRASESLLQDRCSALVLISPGLDERELAALSGRCPVVLVGSELRAGSVDVVRSDDRQGVALAVRHLVESGHRDIHFVDGGAAVLGRTRRAAYLDAMATHGLGGRARVLAGHADEESGVAAATTVLARRRRPTAVLAHNDMTAFGLLLTLRMRGVDVPGEISVVGYDDTRLAALANVELTSVNQDPAAFAEAAVRQAVARAEGERGPAREYITSPRLVLRGSSASAPRDRSGPARPGTR